MSETKNRIRITKQEFNDAIESIKLQSDRDNAFSEAMSVAFPGVSTGYMMRPDTEAIIQGMINLLSTLMGDSDGWIEWFVYECDLGSVDMKAKMQDGNIIVSRTASDLYDIITYEVKN